MRRHLAAVRPDLVHTHMGASDFLGTAAARSLGLPVVSTVHSMQWPKRGREGAKEVLMAAARRWCADRVVAVSDSARERYTAEWRERAAHVTVVRNGVRGIVPEGAGARVRAELGIPADAVVVTILAALRPEKAHDVAAEAVARVRERVPSAHLLVVGEGPTLPDVERWLAPLGDAATIAGYRTDVMAVLGATDVLLHPPRFDALPTAVIEAGAAGVPVVATRVGGIPEIVARRRDRRARAGAARAGRASPPRSSRSSPTRSCAAAWAPRRASASCASSAPRAGRAASARSTTRSSRSARS